MLRTAFAFKQIRVMLIVVLATTLQLPWVISAQVSAQTPVPTADLTSEVVSNPTNVDTASLDTAVEDLLTTMSVADRVGQLFLITFNGNDVDFDSDIAELIYGYRVGGVVIEPSNRNISNGTGEDTPYQVAILSNRLQSVAYGLLLPAEDALQPLPAALTSDADYQLEEMTGVAAVSLPLFVGVSQLGDGLPETSLRTGFTPLPSQMAIGATWNPSLAQDIGVIVGDELRAVGVNMLLGPNLDVLDDPKSSPVGRLGVHMFGGDPFWVGQMGQAYIKGVHAGSQGQVATIAGHFPGAGDIDRLPDEEVSTVQRPLAELKQIALPSFRAVTGGADSSIGPAQLGVTDGLMSSHARYNAFQGSSLGRNTPISLAPELETVLEQEGFGGWRSNGGVLVSAELGAPAIRRHYAVSPTEFPFRRIALDAFTAGHDLLYLGRFASDDTWESQRMNIKETIGFFQERYVDDPDFAQQVDNRVRRILRLKLRLYGADFASQSEPLIPLNNVLVQEPSLVSMAERQVDALASVAEVARESISVLYPDPREATEVVSRVPQSGENILVFTDSRLNIECEDCAVDVPIAPDAISDIVLRLYGPGATDQLVGDEITSLTFSDLYEFLNAEVLPEETPAAIPTVTPVPTSVPEEDEASPNEAIPVPSVQETEPSDESSLDKNAKTAKVISEADWILFAMLDVNDESHPQSSVVKRFLRQHSDDLASKNVAVFALNAPYFLDATEISKLNAYYGVYGKTKPFLENAVRALFRAFTPDAAPPVKVAGTRFSSLAERLSPDPARPIPLSIADNAGVILADQSLVGESAPLIGPDTHMVLQAGPISDRNGNMVRDGEVVEFVLTVDGDGDAPRIEQALTRSGVATQDLLLDRGGLLEVTARAGDAISGAPLRLSIQNAVSEEANAEQSATQESVETPVPTPAPVAMADPAGVESDSQPVLDPPASIPISISSLVISLLTIIVMVSMLIILQVRITPRRTLVHSILWAINCGLLAYILYGFGLLPGTEWLQTSLRTFGAAPVVLLAMLIPLLWLQLRAEQ